MQQFPHLYFFFLIIHIHNTLIINRHIKQNKKSKIREGQQCSSFRSAIEIFFCVIHISKNQKNMKFNNIILNFTKKNDYIHCQCILYIVHEVIKISSILSKKLFKLCSLRHNVNLIWRTTSHKFLFSSKLQIYYFL